MARYFTAPLWPQLELKAYMVEMDALGKVLPINRLTDMFCPVCEDTRPCGLWKIVNPPAKSPARIYVCRICMGVACAWAGLKPGHPS